MDDTFDLIQALREEWDAVGGSFLGQVGGLGEDELVAVDAPSPLDDGRRLSLPDPGVPVMSPSAYSALNCGPASLKKFRVSRPDQTDPCPPLGADRLLTITTFGDKHAPRSDA